MLIHLSAGTTNSGKSTGGFSWNFVVIQDTIFLMSLQPGGVIKGKFSVVIYIFFLEYGISVCLWHTQPDALLQVWGQRENHWQSYFQGYWTVAVSSGCKWSHTFSVYLKMKIHLLVCLVCTLPFKIKMSGASWLSLLKLCSGAWFWFRRKPLTSCRALVRLCARRGWKTRDLVWSQMLRSFHIFPIW